MWLDVIRISRKEIYAKKMEENMRSERGNKDLAGAGLCPK
jgi:hypothetical protein